jgi:hypothetical protein
MHQAVHNVDFVAARQQLLSEDAADVSGAAGYKNLHLSLLFGRLSTQKKAIPRTAPPIERLRFTL